MLSVPKAANYEGEFGKGCWLMFCHCPPGRAGLGMGHERQDQRDSEPGPSARSMQRFLRLWMCGAVDGALIEAHNELKKRTPGSRQAR